jgi:hypothetical protein
MISVPAKSGSPRSHKKNSKATQGSHPDAASSSCAFKTVFGSHSTMMDVYTASLQPLTAKFIKGFNCAYFVLGEAYSGKKSLLFGSKQGTHATLSSKARPASTTKPSCLVMQLLHDVFQSFKTKSSSSSWSSTPSASLTSHRRVLVQFCAFDNAAVQGGGIIDLLEKTSSTLDSHPHGDAHKGAHHEIITDKYQRDPLIPLSIHDQPDAGCFVRGLSHIYVCQLPFFFSCF